VPLARSLRTGYGFELVGVPEGMERLGGVDFDEAVFGHVRYVVAESLAEPHQALPHLWPPVSRPP